MTEELYIISGGQRISLDLNIPSGITLKYSSNLFTDLSNITASHSYTFKLPLTENNRRAFDLADDVRHTSQLVRKRLSCEYFYNGTPIVSRGNIYLSSVEDGTYQAVLTWEVVEGLQKMKDEDLSLCELRKLLGDEEELTNDIVYIGRRDEVFDNTKNILYPLYNCGAIYYEWYWNADTQYDHTFDLKKLKQRVYASGESMPVMPVRHILSMINKAYGTKFELGEDVSFGASDDWTVYDPISMGMIPLVDRKMTDKQIDAFSFSLNNARGFSSWFLDDMIVATFSNYAKGDLSPISPEGGTAFTVGYNLHSYLAVELDGILTVWCNKSEGVVLRVIGITSRAVGSDIEVTHDELATMEPTDTTYISSTKYVYTFDFRKGNWRKRISVPESSHAMYVIAFDADLGYPAISGNVKVYVDNSNSNTPAWCDSITNLPDVKCLDFVKSLYLMVGAFPKMNSDGSVTPLYYRSLYTKMSDRDAVDWSDKVIDTTTDLAENTSYAVEGLAQNNYYLMANDDPEKTEQEKNSQGDIYADSYGVIKMDSGIADRKKDIYKAPWYGRYIRNSEFGWMGTGETIKAWTPEYKKAEPKPAYGLAYQQGLERRYPYEEDGQIYYEYEHDEYNKIFSMSIYEPFRYMFGYTFLEQILADVHVIKEKLLLTEIDLVNIDYTMPVYIEKYNSYFAIISIEANLSNGYVTAELIKLPTS